MARVAGRDGVMDIIERLITFEGSDDLGDGDFSLCIDAAREIERLHHFARWCISDEFDSRELSIMAKNALTA